MKKRIWGMLLAVVCIVNLVACAKDTELGIQSEGDKEQQGKIEESFEKEELPEEPKRVELLMVGDILLHDPIEEKARQGDGSYNFTSIFLNTKNEIANADLALVNQEVIIGGAELGVSGYPNFNAPYEIADELVNTGFDVICHGTNHALDRGKNGIINSINYWQEQYPQIAVLGIHDSAESQGHIYVYQDANTGMKIAILNYTYGTNGISLPSGMPYAVDYLEEGRVVSDVAEAKELADFVVVCPHWGTEYQLETDAMQEKWTNIFYRNGVDLVIGTHPHVIEPIRLINEEGNDHQMLVYYSLGNFVNATGDSGRGIANRAVGGMAEIMLEMSEDGKVTISDYGIRGLVCHVDKNGSLVTVYFLSDYTEELAAENIFAVKDSAFSKAYCVDLCNQVWGDIWN